MSTEPTARWYVVYTQARAEAKTAFHLLRQGFETYLPRYRKMRRHARRSEEVLAPLFPRYLFVKVDTANQRWRAIQSTLGVVRLICNGEEPAPAPDDVVQAIRQSEDGNGSVRVADGLRFRPGDTVHVREGLLSACACMGLVEACTDGDRIVILLDILGRKARVSLNKASLQAA